MNTTTMQKGLYKSGEGARLLKVAPDGAEGVVRVAFAQLNVVDHDGDITLPGAFQTGQKVKVCQTGHAHHRPVVGTGTIIGEQAMSDGSLWAVAELKYFLETDTGAEHYRIIKAVHDAGHTQEWSYGYDILDAEQTMVDGKRAQALKSLSVYEISDVLRGAGIGTHTLAVKGAECPTCGAVKHATDDDTEPQPDDATAPVDVADEDAAAAKGRAEQAHLQWLEMKARQLSRRPVH